MKKTILAAGVAAMMCGSAQADTLLGLYIGGQYWMPETTGSFGEGSNAPATFEFDDEAQSSFYVAFEHPIPLIPNIKVAAATLDSIGGAQLGDDDFVFNGESYPAGTQLDTSIDASFIDYTLYYELFDNDLLTFDFGLTARDLDTTINVSEASMPAQDGLEASGMIPMLYLNGIVGLPFTGFNVFAEANISGYGDQSVYDAQVGISYAILDNIAVDFDINLGYRIIKLELDDVDNFNSDLSYEGFFAGAVIHF